jgi:predicted RNA binding protein YcfA (HicA-like mRNA interferase family)
MTKKVKEIIDLLEANGWHYLGTKGDHHEFMKEGARRPVIVAGKRNQDMAEGTFNAILREAGLK